MKTAIEKALEKIEGQTVKVDKMEEPKKKKGDNMECCSMYNGRPSLYLNDKEFSGIQSLNVGDKVVLVIECEIMGVNSYSNLDKDKKPVKKFNCDLAINAISDITG